MEEVYTEIKVSSRLKSFALIVGAKELRDPLCGCVTVRSRIQPPASQSNTSHKVITYDLINILVKDFSPWGSVTTSAEM